MGAVSSALAPAAAVMALHLLNRSGAEQRSPLSFLCALSNCLAAHLFYGSGSDVSPDINNICAAPARRKYLFSFPSVPALGAEALGYGLCPSGRHPAAARGRICPK